MCPIITKLFAQLYHSIEGLLGEVDPEVHEAQVRHLNAQIFVHGRELQLCGSAHPILVQGGACVGQPHVLFGPPQCMIRPINCNV